MSRLITTTDFSKMADETIDFSDRAELATFVRYIESDSHDVKEEFLGLVQIIGIKMLPKYVKKEKIIIIIIKKSPIFFEARVLIVI